METVHLALPRLVPRAPGQPRPWSPGTDDLTGTEDPTGGPRRRWSIQIRPSRPLGCWGTILVIPCWLAAAGLTILSVLRATGWDGNPFIPALVAFMPWAGLLAPCLLGAAVLLRRRALGAVSVLLVAVQVIWSVPRFTSEPPPDQLAGSARLRVMTVNAHVGQLDQGELLRTLNQERPDLLVLTEVPEATLERFEAAGLRDLLPGKAARPGPGADGTAIYARAALALRDAGDAGGETIFRNPRATVELAGRTATIQAAHPPPPLPIASAIDIWRRDLRLLARSAAATSGPLIALGDFNASVDHAGFRALLADGRLRDAHDARGRGLVATWPATDGAGLPRFAHIDHVLVSREFAVLGVHERELPLLDHSVVVADLALLEG